MASIRVLCYAGESIEVPAVDIARSVILTNARSIWKHGERPLSLSDITPCDFRSWMDGPVRARELGLEQALRCLEVACRLDADDSQWATGMLLEMAKLL